MHRLVNGPRAAEPEALVEAQGPFVAGCDLEVGLREARVAEAVQGLEQKPAAQPAAAMVADNPEVLDRPEALVAQSLHRRAGAEGPGNQPRRLRHEIRPRDDVVHQLPAAGDVTQAREDEGIDLVAEAEELDLGV